MNYGHLELRIEELLKERDISKNTICKSWIFRGQILTDIAEMNFKGWMQI